MKMKNKWLASVIFILICSSINAQTLVKIGEKEFSLKQFEENYNDAIQSGEQYASKKEYFESFANYQIKLSEAYAQNLQNSFAINNELNNYKEYLLQKFRYDKITFEHLVKEAKERSAINLSVSYIMIPIKQLHSTEEESLINEAYKLLETGKNFEEVALQYSKDTTVIHNKGHIGNITSFILPYKIENVIYKLNDGEYSTPFRFANKWFIFKRNATTPSKGKVQIQQIVFYYPGEINSANKDSLFKLATEVRSKINKEYSFDDAVEKYHGEINALNNRGILNSIGVGEYDQSFENEIFKLNNIGDISAPFETSYGFHIVKLLNKFSNDSISLETWEQKVENNDRIAVAYEALHRKIEKDLQLNKLDSTELYDLLFSYQNEFKSKIFTSDSSIVLARFGTQKLKLNDWKNYYQILSRNKSFFEKEELKFYFDQFLQQRLLSYYRNNLDKYDLGFSKQLQSFTESVMLFELMQQNIWNQYDSSKLQEYYKKHINEFRWNPYAKVWYLTALTQENISSIINKINSVDQLKNLTSNDIYYIHSAKEELSSHKEKKIEAGAIFKDFQEGMQSVIGIESIHEGGEIKTFDEAIIDVNNAYQKKLEINWVNELKKKYPVVINKKLYKKL